jgi:hypothetical protein
MCGTDNDLIVMHLQDSKAVQLILAYLGAGVCYTDITSRVTLLGEFASEEFIEFSAEYTVSYELALFADLSGHIEDGSMSAKTDR